MLASRAGRPAQQQHAVADVGRRRPPVQPLLVALLVLLTAGSAVTPAAAAPGGRRQLRAQGRSMQQQPCGTCPTDDASKAAAKAACQQAPQGDRDTLLRAVVQFCPRLGFTPPTCCPAMPVGDAPKWTLWSSCLWWALPLTPAVEVPSQPSRGSLD